MKKLIKPIAICLILLSSSSVLFAQVNANAHQLIICTYRTFEHVAGDDACIRVQVYFDFERGVFWNGTPGDFSRATTSTFLAITDPDHGRVAIRPKSGFRLFEIATDATFNNVLETTDHFRFIGGDNQAYNCDYEALFGTNTVGGVVKSGNKGGSGSKNGGEGVKKPQNFTIQFYNPNGSGGDVHIYGVLTKPGASFNFCSSPFAIDVTLSQGQYSNRYQFNGDMILTWQSYYGNCGGDLRNSGTASINQNNGGTAAVNHP